ncbi:MAG: hypothetical protein ACRD4Y_15305 [Candidatus Acidiferrales bacterium]
MRSWIAIFLALLVFPAFAEARQNGDQDDRKNMPMGPPSSAPKSGDQQSKSPPPKNPDTKQNAQDSDMQEMPGMGAMHSQGMKIGKTGTMMATPDTFLQEILQHATSGTSAEPDSTPAPMLMTTKRNWKLMLHGNAFLIEQQESSPRGGGKLFSTNWIMGMAQHDAGPGVFTARTMLSLEPATITGRQYPLLFQQGETAYGKPIADGQHPHNLFMEIAAIYDLKLGTNGLLSIFAAPIGDPALGPIAFPHRASAAEDPVATLAHHQEDSTHIAEDVVTVGATYRIARIEASGFHGREPNENRWNIAQGKIDSWSTRMTIQPDNNWSGQFSFGRLTSPEALFPDENQERMTASIAYNRPFRGGNWASTLIWGRTRSLADSVTAISYTFESTAGFLKRNHAWTRIEDIARSNELLLGENLIPPGFQEQTIGRVQAYTFGYDRDFGLIPHVATAIGAQITAYGVGDNLKPVYGSRPASVAVFVRIRPE